MFLLMGEDISKPALGLESLVCPGFVCECVCEHLCKLISGIRYMIFEDGMGLRLGKIPVSTCLEYLSNSLSFFFKRTFCLGHQKPRVVLAVMQFIRSPSSHANVILLTHYSPYPALCKQ